MEVVVLDLTSAHVLMDLLETAVSKVSTQYEKFFEV